MSSYLKQIRYETKFDGDTVVAVMRPLEFADLLTIDPLLTVTSEARDRMRDAVSSSDLKRLEDEVGRAGAAVVNKALEVLPRYIISLEGLIDNEGQPITVQEVLGSGYFVQLVSELITTLRAKSTPGNP